MFSKNLGAVPLIVNHLPLLPISIDLLRSGTIRSISSSLPQSIPRTPAPGGPATSNIRFLRVVAFLGLLILAHPLWSRTLSAGTDALFEGSFFALMVVVIGIILTHWKTWFRRSPDLKISFSTALSELKRYIESARDDKGSDIDRQWAQKEAIFFRTTAAHLIKREVFHDAEIAAGLSTLWVLDGELPWLFPVVAFAGVIARMAWRRRQLKAALHPAPPPRQKKTRQEKVLEELARFIQKVEDPNILGVVFPGYTNSRICLLAKQTLKAPDQSQIEEREIPKGILPPIPIKQKSYLRSNLSVPASRRGCQ